MKFDVISFRRTEVFEYARRLRADNIERFEHFYLYKYLYAELLMEAGLVHSAARYINTLVAMVKTVEKSTIVTQFSRGFLLLLLDFSLRVRNHSVMVGSHAISFDQEWEEELMEMLKNGSASSLSNSNVDVSSHGQGDQEVDKDANGAFTMTENSSSAFIETESFQGINPGDAAYFSVPTVVGGESISATMVSTTTYGSQQQHVEPPPQTTTYGFMDGEGSGNLLYQPPPLTPQSIDQTTMVPMQPQRTDDTGVPDDNQYQHHHSQEREQQQQPHYGRESAEQQPMDYQGMGVSESQQSNLYLYGSGGYDDDGNVATQSQQQTAYEQNNYTAPNNNNNIGFGDNCYGYNESNNQQTAPTDDGSYYNQSNNEVTEQPSNQNYGQSHFDTTPVDQYASNTDSSAQPQQLQPQQAFQQLGGEAKAEPVVTPMYQPNAILGNANPGQLPGVSLMQPEAPSPIYGEAPGPIYGQPSYAHEDDASSYTGDERSESKASERLEPNTNVAPNYWQPQWQDSSHRGTKEV